jgi:hypothetical protein
VSRTLSAAPVAAFAFVVILALAATAARTGFLTDDALRLWAGASTAADGDFGIGRIVAAYPTLPFLTTTFIAWITPSGTPASALVSAGLFALLVGACFKAFLDAGLPRATAAAATVLIAFHPALVRAALAGPADMYLTVSLFAFAGALYALRARSGSSEVMAAGLLLLALAFAHPMGAAVAIASVPFLVFAVRPLLVASSAFNVVVALVFPTVFAVAGFAYVSWVFPGAGWSFFAAPTASLSAWSAQVARVFGDGVSGLLALDVSLAMAAALAVGAPSALVMLLLVHRRRPLLVPALVFAATIVAATAISVTTGLFGDPTALAIAAPVLAATVLTRVPMPSAGLRPFIIPLLALGWLGGTASLALVDPAAVAHARALLAGQSDEPERLDALGAGGAARTYDDVLVDADNAPAFVLGRGRARGILGPQSEPFALAVLFGRIESAFVAIPDPQSNPGANDRLNKAFPRLYRQGMPGYGVVYQNNTWRVFGRLNNYGTFER